MINAREYNIIIYNIISYMSLYCNENVYVSKKIYNFFKF